MGKMVKAELYKLFKSRAFKILACIAIAFAVLNVAMCEVLNEDFLEASLGSLPEAQKEEMLNQIVGQTTSDQVVIPGNLGFHTTGAEDLFNITPVEVFHVSFGAGVLEILFAVLVGALVAKEYSDGTIKNTLAYGKKRESFYISKFLGLLLGSTILVALQVFLAALGRALMYEGPNPFELNQMGEILGVFIASMAVYAGIIAIIMMIATIVKSNGSTIGISCAIFILIPTVAAFIYGTYDWYDKIYEVMPFYNIALVTAINATSNQVITASLTGVITCLLALIGGILIFKKQDIK